MKDAKNPGAKLTSTAGQRSKKSQAKYPGQEIDVPILMAEDAPGEYGKSASQEARAFRSSLAFTLMGCARGPLSDMTDEEIKAMMVRDKYGL
nr:hypothetical protein [uncultured Dyadobacter sp.]